MKNKTTLFIIIVCLSTISINAQEIILNGDFEDGLNQWNTDGYPINIIHDNVFSGTKSLFINTSNEEHAYLYQFFPSAILQLEADFWVFPSSTEYDQVIQFLANWPPNQGSKVILRIGINSDSLYCHSLDSLISLPPILELYYWNHISVESYPTGEIEVYVNEILRFSFYNQNPIPIETLMLGDVSDIEFEGGIYYDSVSVRSDDMTNTINETFQPAEFLLMQNYPNPFNPITTIKYQLKNRSNIKIIIYDVSGRKVKELINDVQNAGVYNISWEGKNDNNRPVGTGIYFYRLISDEFTDIKKMVLTR